MFYIEKKLKSFMQKQNIFNLYLTHLSTFEPRFKMMEWSKNGVETGPLSALYSHLCRIEETHEIWQNLFEICARDRINDQILQPAISEQTVADFIALSLRHYIKENVKKSNKMGALSDSDRYILSIILPYFGFGIKSIHKSIRSENLSSGLFNHFISDYLISRVPVERLKNDLLKHLHAEKYEVVKQYFVAVLQETFSCCRRRFLKIAKCAHLLQHFACS